MQIYNRHIIGCLLTAITIQFTNLTGQESTRIITLSEAVEKAVQNHPSLAKIEYLKTIADGEIQEAGLSPDLELETEFENFLGTGDYSGIKGLEVTVGLRQVIERGDKRRLRENAATRSKESLQIEEVILRTQIRNEVKSAYAEVLLAQQNLILQYEWLDLEKEAAGVVEKLVQNAGASKVELARAELAVEQQHFKVQTAESELDNTKAGLAKLWGEPSLKDFQANGALTIEHNTPTWEELLAALESSPYLTRYDSYKDTRTAELALEKAQKTQNISLFGGVRHTRENRDTALVAGFSIPLPTKKRYEGKIQSAQARIRMVEVEKAEVRRQMTLELSDAYQSLRQASLAVKSLNDRLLPAAQTTLDETQTGYQRGQFSLQAVLGSREALFEIRQQQFEAISQYLKAKTQIENLTQSVSL